MANDRLAVYDLHHLWGIPFANSGTLWKRLFNPSEIIFREMDVYRANILFQAGEVPPRSGRSGS